jgi:hypothetical protein
MVGAMSIVVSVCLPLIIRLSSSRESPKSQEEYLSVKTFELKIQLDESKSTIKVLQEGPSVLPAYDIHPIDRCSFHDESLPKISGKEILAVGLQPRHKCMPQKVFTPDGSTHFFKPCLFGMEEHFIDEVQSLIKLRTEGIEISVPSIEGLAIISEGNVFAMLAQWIEGCAISAISQECRRRQSHSRETSFSAPCLIMCRPSLMQMDGIRNTSYYRGRIEHNGKRYRLSGLFHPKMSEGNEQNTRPTGSSHGPDHAFMVSGLAGPYWKTKDPECV